jgi:SIR2-like domain
MSASLAVVAQGPGYPELAPEEFVRQVRRGLVLGQLAPYLGPGVAALTRGDQMPLSYLELADYLGRKVALPKRAKGNPWAAAQYIESYKHRASLVALLRDAFVGKRDPLPFHHFLAALCPPLIVDTWYDGTMRQALEATQGFCEFQGTDRTGVTTPVWYKVYNAAGAEISAAEATEAPCVLYTPHGSRGPGGRFLLSDADYVEVLTEIDIQTPIPEAVKERRGQLGFVFLGCRFHDQLLRTFARQIAKRSMGPHYILFSEPPTRMERRFAAELSARVALAPLERVVSELCE